MKPIFLLLLFLSYYVSHGSGWGENSGRFRVLIEINYFVFCMLEGRELLESTGGVTATEKQVGAVAVELEAALSLFSSPRKIFCQEGVQEPPLHSRCSPEQQPRGQEV